MPCCFKAGTCRLPGWGGLVRCDAFSCRNRARLALRAGSRGPSPRPSPRNAGGGRKPGHRPRPGFPRPLPRGRGRVRGRARSGRATGSRDPRLSPGPRRPDGKARAGATATVLGRRPVAPWHFQCGTGIPARDSHWKSPRAGCPWHIVLRAEQALPPNAGGLGSPRSRGNAHGQDARGTLQALAPARTAAGHCPGAWTPAEGQPPRPTRKRARHPGGHEPTVAESAAARRRPRWKVNGRLRPRPGCCGEPG